MCICDLSTVDDNNDNTATHDVSDGKIDVEVVCHVLCQSVVTASDHTVHINSDVAIEHGTSIAYSPVSMSSKDNFSQVQ